MARVAAAFLAACVGVAWSGSALAQTSNITRTSSFAYDPASGLLTQEVVEPGTPSLRLQTDYTHDAFGNKTAATVSGVDIVSRTSSSAYDAKGQFVTTNTNALGQSETAQFDQRFAKLTSQTGPNGLTTTWSYDSLGREILEVHADGTRTTWSYQYCSWVNGGTATCPSGTAYLVKATPLAADGATQNGPVGIVYMDTLDRELARDTQGFDGSAVRASRQYDSFGRVQQVSRPYFLTSGTPQWTVFTYDTLSRTVAAALPDGSMTQQAYHGLVTSETNGLDQTRVTTRNSRGEVVFITDATGKTMAWTYDAVGNLVKTSDTVGNVTTATYDLRGRKIASSDPDLGFWTYLYDTLGEVVSQTDAKNQTTTFSYDKLGRPMQRVEPDMTSAWVYDTAQMGIGKLASAGITAGTGAGYGQAFTYDSLGRPSQTATTIDGTTYTMAGGYDANGRLNRVTYPSGFAASYSYNALGYSTQLVDGASAQVYWTANALDAEQHITQQTAGNGVVTTRGFDPATGRLITVTAGAGSAVQNFAYTYDRLGNPLTRVDAITSLSESFAYDTLNRLTSATLAANVAPAKAFTYDAIGNLTSKSDIGTYSYPPAGSPLPHAVTSISGSIISTTFTYDANGNQTSGLGRTIAWTSYNKPASITSGTRTISFLDDFGHQRFKQVTPEGTTLYFDGFGVHAELMVSSASKWNEYLTVGNVMVGERFLTVATSTVALRYFHTDHLGSVSVITDEAGAVVERLSYDPWGKRRFANGADDPSGSITSQSTRGFTGEEELSVGSLVHLNGRVYDSLIGRMLSADPTVPDPQNAQAWNRYSYVGNDPLAFTDPTGFSWLSNFFHSVGSFFKRILSNPIVRAVVQIALTYFIGAVLSAAIVTGLAGGKLGDMLKAAAIAGATTAAFLVVGTMTAGIIQQFGAIAGRAFDIASSAGVGCLSSVASGGSCKSGALAAAVSAAADPVLPTDLVGGTIAHAIVGGLASVAGGGKFADGAVTGAFQYMFSPHAGSEGGGPTQSSDDDDNPLTARAADDGIDPNDPVQRKLQQYTDQAANEVDALGDKAFSQNTQDSINRGNVGLRSSARGRAIENRVRQMVFVDPDLQSILVGKSNYGVDYTDTSTGKQYEITTPGQLPGKQYKYGARGRVLFIDTMRRPWGADE